MDIVIALEYHLYGPDKDNNKLSRKVLEKKETYDDIIYPYNYSPENLEIDLDDKKVYLKFKNLTIDNLAKFKKNLIRNFADGWGEGIFDFGKKYYYYANHQPLEKEKVKDIEKYDFSYYVLDSVILPPNSDYKNEHCKLEKDSKALYFYKDIYLEKFRDEYYINLKSTPEILKGSLNIKRDDYLGTRLPKKYHAEVLETYEYLICRAPKKDSGKILLEKDENIDELFLRLDKVKGLAYKNNIVYRGYLSRIAFRNPEIII